MSEKVKFLLCCLISGLLLLGIGWFGEVRFGMDLVISTALVYAGMLLINLSAFVGVICIIGFKRFAKWFYFTFVVCFIFAAVIVAPFVDLITLAIYIVISVILGLTLIPIFKRI